MTQPYSQYLAYVNGSTRNIKTFLNGSQICRVSNSKKANLKMTHYDFYYLTICLKRCISVFVQIFCLFWSESPFQNSIFFKKHHFWTVRKFAASQTQKRQILKCLIIFLLFSPYAQKGVFQFLFKYLAYFGQKVHFKIQFFSKITNFGLFAILPRLKIKNGKS